MYENSWNGGINKKISLYKMSFYPERNDRSKSKTKFKLDLCNYATQSDLKNVTSVDASKFAR